MQTDYRYALTVTSQFPFCSVPLRLDSYSRCQFACRYCFAAARGGNRPRGQIQLASPAKLARVVESSKRGEGGVLGEMLRAEVPVHFGGMADPFPPMEDDKRVSLSLLAVLARNRVPTIISAKGVPARVDEYVDVIREGRMMVQFSFGVVAPRAAPNIEAGVPGSRERLKFMSKLARAGVPVSIRLQPVFPGQERYAHAIISRAATAGARHAALEFLKYPMELNWSGLRRLDASTKSKVWAVFKENGATRIGREYVLPVGYRSERALDIKRSVRASGLTFAFADNDLLHFSDGEACCTGADLLIGTSGYGFNFHRAVRRADSEGIVRFAAIANEWRPTSSVAQYINSRTRGRGRSLEAQILNGWNGSLYSPQAFYGVSDTGGVDENGYKLYKLDLALKQRFMEAGLCKVA